MYLLLHMVIFHLAMFVFRVQNRLKNFLLSKRQETSSTKITAETEADVSEMAKPDNVPWSNKEPKRENVKLLGDYILSSGGSYATYHLLSEPETTIDKYRDYNFHHYEDPYCWWFRNRIPNHRLSVTKTFYIMGFQLPNSTGELIPDFERTINRRIPEFWVEIIGSYFSLRIQTPP